MYLRAHMKKQGKGQGGGLDPLGVCGGGRGVTDVDSSSGDVSCSPLTRSDKWKKSVGVEICRDPRRGRANPLFFRLHSANRSSNSQDSVSPFRNATPRLRHYPLF
jgi:hypothetical protein